MITKRDGTKQPFSLEAIIVAVFKAAREAELDAIKAKGVANMVAASVYRKLGKEDGVTVDCIQDAVEERLMVTKEKSTARAYIRYRAERDRVREGKSVLFRDIDGFLNLTDDTHAKANANKAPEQIVTHRDLIAGIVSKQYADVVLPVDVREAHEKGLCYLHDKDYLISKGIHNCGVYDFEYMLANGVKLGDVSIESPKSVGTAANVICQILAKISGSSYGGQSLHEFDKVLKPYVEKSREKLIKEQKEYGLPDKYVETKLAKEIYDACQLVIYQVQTVSSPNGQSSFYSMSLSLSTDPVCKLIKEQYLHCHIAGIGKNKTSPIFPKVLYFVEDGINLKAGDPNYEEFQLALECSTKHLYPDFIMAPNNRKMTGSGQVVSPMGCRSFVPNYIEGGKEKPTGRFNIGVSTVNLPYVALLAGKDKVTFFKELEIACDLAFKGNMFRVERFKGTKAKVSPILWQYGALATLDAEDTIDHLLYSGNATCSIGYGGLAECIGILCDNTKEFAMSVLAFMKNLTDKYTEETNISFSLYGTPLESGAYKFAESIKEGFPEYNLGRDYVTNSFHITPSTSIDMLDKFEWESDFYLLSSGGNVNNIEIPNLAHNLPALEGVIKMAYDKVNYLICNQPVDKCFECGFSGEFVATLGGHCCPTCGNSDPETTNCIRRISGYIHNATARPANKGKYAEQSERVKNM